VSVGFAIMILLLLKNVLEKISMGFSHITFTFVSL
jgi:hypothetical protein